MSSDSKILSFLKTWFEVGYYVLQGKRNAYDAKKLLQKLIDTTDKEPAPEYWEKDILNRIEHAISDNKLYIHICRKNTWSGI